MRIKIKRRWSLRSLYTGRNSATTCEAVVQAVLTGVNLSRARLSRAHLSGANLRGAKLSFADLRRACLTHADLAGASFYYADLSGADLSRVSLSHANLRGADLRGADLRGADLRGADLSSANLTGALFDERLLNIPRVEQLDAQVLAAITTEGGDLYMSRWHWTSPSASVCSSAHCRAGWAIHLAGEAGYTLERLVGPSAAGALIYARSTGRPVPDFRASDKEALEDIKRCAGLAQSAGA